MDFDQYYASLPIGIVVLDSELTPIYFNANYQKIMELGKAEYGSWQKAHQTFVGDAKTYRNRKTAVIRFIDQANKTSSAFSVNQVKKDFKQKTKSLRDCTILCLTEQDPRLKIVNDPNTDVYISGVLRVNFHNRTAYVGRTLVKLSDVEFRLLTYFCRNEDRVLGKEELLKMVWGKRSLATRTADVYVTRLRKKLKEAGLRQQLIKTLHAQGYLLSPQN